MHNTNKEWRDENPKNPNPKLNDPAVFHVFFVSLNPNIIVVLVENQYFDSFEILKILKFSKFP